MKSVTEFASFTLKSGLTAKSALAAEGKSPEEIHTALGEKFKFVEEKLKHFVAALGVAEKYLENLKRVLVIQYADGENPQPKAEKVEEHHYLPEFHTEQKKVHEKKAEGKGGGRGGKGGGRGEKESPWGLSPEQKAAKKAAQSAGAAANKAAKPS